MSNRKTVTYAARLDGKIVGKAEVEDMMPFMDSPGLRYAVIVRTKERREHWSHFSGVVRMLEKDEVCSVKFFSTKLAAQEYIHRAEATNQKNYRVIVPAEVLKRS